MVRFTGFQNLLTIHVATVSPTVSGCMWSHLSRRETSSEDKIMCNLQTLSPSVVHTSVSKQNAHIGMERPMAANYQSIKETFKRFPIRIKSAFLRMDRDPCETFSTWIWPLIISICSRRTVWRLSLMTWWSIDMNPATLQTTLYLLPCIPHPAHSVQ